MTNLTSELVEEFRKQFPYVAIEWDKESNQRNIFSQIEAFMLTAFDRVRAETEKAFGGCTKCYGKGYATVMVNEVGAEDFGGEGYETGPHTRMEFCACQRGQQIAKIILKLDASGDIAP